ncbi:sigma-70 family RNA polymerase sigma factor [Streptomyces decoyicus]
MAHLEDRERTLIQLRFGDAMTQTQIADELGLSQMHVSRLLTRTYDTLRASLLAEA